MASRPAHLYVMPGGYGTGSVGVGKCVAKAVSGRIGMAWIIVTRPSNGSMFPLAGVL
jgi:hypothetical protein